jgi:glycosyltransferase involved in cell wall biosynthesis
MDGSAVSTLAAGRGGQMPPITVLHVLESLEIGGSERQLVNIILRSDTGRFRHVVCTVSGGGPLVDVLRARNVPVRELGVRSRGVWPVVRRLWQLVREVRPDIIHAALFRPGIAGRVVGRLCDLPVVTTLVNTSYEPEWFMDNPKLRPWKARLAHGLDRATCRWGDAFVAVSEAVKSSAVRRLAIPPRRVVVIPRGLSSDLDRAVRDADVDALRASLGLDGAYPILLNIGRLVPQKGQQYAIQAMAEVVAAYPSARLLIAGEGWFRPQLEALVAALGLRRHVTLLGERSDGPALLAVADIFVFPSLFEGAANALIEAMAASKPCVASRIPSLIEASGDGQAAVLVDVRSASALAAGVLRLANDRAQAVALGQVASRWVRNRLDYGTIVARHEALYETLAGKDAVGRRNLLLPSWPLAG